MGTQRRPLPGLTSTIWARYTEWPLAAIAAIFLVAWSWQIIGDLRGVWGAVAEIVIDFTWVVFLVDYVVRLLLAQNRLRWFATHLLDLATVALPLLRPLRLLRLVTLVSVFGRALASRVRGRVIIYTGGATVLLVWVAALSVLDAERASGEIRDLGDALWWTFVTITTVGYGDYFPTTIEGRIVAIFVMLGGIALIGVVTGSLASWIVERVAATEAAEEKLTRNEVADLSREVSDLRRAIAELRPQSRDVGKPDG